MFVNGEKGLGNVEEEEEEQEQDHVEEEEQEERGDGTKVEEEEQGNGGGVGVIGGRHRELERQGRGGKCLRHGQGAGLSIKRNKIN